MRFIIAAMIVSVLSILAFKYADHSIGAALMRPDAGRNQERRS
ncbi:hypothetical protein RHI9324_02535 [Rhizobium sp. CECT 9324]|nr:hypothetical protein RHI9324_02535 [Rhizobium sp. CECT 9324]